MKEVAGSAFAGAHCPVRLCRFRISHGRSLACSWLFVGLRPRLHEGRPKYPPHHRLFWSAFRKLLETPFERIRGNGTTAACRPSTSSAVRSGVLEAYIYGYFQHIARCRIGRHEQRHKIATERFPHHHLSLYISGTRIDSKTTKSLQKEKEKEERPRHT